MEKTYFRILYQRINDNSKTWYRKGCYATQEQAEKYISVLEQVSNIYSTLRIESFIVSVSDPVQKESKKAGKKAVKGR